MVVNFRTNAFHDHIFMRTNVCLRKLSDELQLFRLGAIEVFTVQARRTISDFVWISFGARWR